MHPLLIFKLFTNMDIKTKIYIDKIVTIRNYIIIPFKFILVTIFEFESWIARYWVSGAHRRLFFAEWRIPKRPEFFDHHIDLYYTWQSSRMAHWLERGIFSTLAIKRGGKLLELGCGDGFNARNFYSSLSESVIACDFNKKAISTAKRKNSQKNINYLLADIRNEMPKGDFDNIVWESAIEHCTEEEIKLIMTDIKHRLYNKSGTLSGHTRSDTIALEQCNYEFKDMADLKRFLTPHFKNVTVFETVFSNRLNLYFWASDGVIPFSENWTHWIN